MGCVPNVLHPSCRRDQDVRNHCCLLPGAYIFNIIYQILTSWNSALERVPFLSVSASWKSKAIRSERASSGMGDEPDPEPTTFCVSTCQQTHEKIIKLGVGRRRAVLHINMRKSPGNKPYTWYETARYLVRRIRYRTRYNVLFCFVFVFESPPEIWWCFSCGRSTEKPKPSVCRIYVDGCRSACPGHNMQF